ncbi:MAG: UDP-N-acetylglucosamine diphosphorylase/glucosamine-1-phosphate N-acetyltransferase [bacterium]|nr:UDP-N-acetylglucosamine diphosphorylase/glucosamine-1-phosphate N-acetyltransferase [bacterium]
MPDSATAARQRVAVILAAGKGTRMRSRRPKVLHSVAGRPILEWILAAARASGCGRLVVVVGHGADEVRSQIAGDDVVWVSQPQQLGTGHALAQAEAEVPEGSTLLVLNGDVPLVAPQTLERLMSAAAAGWGAMAVAELETPGGLGRVLANVDDQLHKIVEAVDATPEELRTKLANAGLYALPAPRIFDYLRRLRTDNAKGEYYLTDALSAAAADGEAISLVRLSDPSEGMGINDRRELAHVHRLLLHRHLDALMVAGVTIFDPKRTVIEPGVEVGPDTVIHPDVTLAGSTRVGSECVLHQGCWIRDSTLEDGVVVEPYSILDGAAVAGGCSVGPFARLRPATVLAPGARVGNFVEVKKSRLGAGSKANHLTYLGDATIGDGANIGAGTITCNYDGESKHRTEIGDGAFVGSDSILVAPVTVGRGATTAAGSVITNDVPDDALGVARGRQRTIPDWTERRGKKKATSR